MTVFEPFQTIPKSKSVLSRVGKRVTKVFECKRFAKIFTSDPKSCIDFNSDKKLAATSI